jgi:hypothetical protein
MKFRINNNNTYIKNLICKFKDVYEEKLNDLFKDDNTIITIVEDMCNKEPAYSIDKNVFISEIMCESTLKTGKITRSKQFEPF